MARALLVDTNRAAYTVYQSLVLKGYEVWVAGGNPQEPLAKICPNYVELDYSDTLALSRLVENNSFDVLVPGCTDVSYEACAEISLGRYPGIDSLETTQVLHGKNQYRKIARYLGIPVPRLVELDEISNFKSVIVKPVDSFSGRGISILNSPSTEQIDMAYNAACLASRTGTALIEEFVDGQLYSHSSFVSDGQVIADFIVREDCTTNPFTVDTSRVEYEFNHEVLEMLRRDNQSLCKHLQLADGLIHTQFILGEESYWAIEVTRRCPGDLYALLIEMSTGYPYGASYAASFLGEQPVPRNAGTAKERIIRHTATSEGGELFWGLNFSRTVGMKFLVPLAEAGDLLEPSPYGRAAVFFLASESKHDQEALYQSLLLRNLYRYNLDPNQP